MPTCSKKPLPEAEEFVLFVFLLFPLFSSFFSPQSQVKMGRCFAKGKHAKHVGTYRRCHRRKAKRHIKTEA